MDINKCGSKVFVSRRFFLSKSLWNNRHTIVLTTVRIKTTKEINYVLVVLILTVVRSIVCRLFRRDVERKKRLDPNTFDPQLFIYIPFLHNFSLLSIFHLGRVVLTCLSTNMKKIEGYS